MISTDVLFSLGLERSFAMFLHPVKNKSELRVERQQMLLLQLLLLPRAASLHSDESVETRVRSLSVDRESKIPEGKSINDNTQNIGIKKTKHGARGPLSRW